MLCGLSDLSFSKRPLESLFSSDTARVLDLLLLNRDFEYTESDIAQVTSLSKESLDTSLSELLENDIIKRNNYGSTITFKINFKSDLANILDKYITTKMNIDIHKAKARSTIIKAIE